MELRDFAIFTDFPTIPDPEGSLNSHGQVRSVRVCDCPKVVERFDTREEAEARAAEVNHSVVVARFS